MKKPPQPRLKPRLKSTATTKDKEQLETTSPQPKKRLAAFAAESLEGKERPSPLPPHPDEKAMIANTSKQVQSALAQAAPLEKVKPLSVSEFLDQLDPGLTPSEIEKLKSMIDSYDQAVSNAKEIDPKVEIKPIEELLGLFSPERVREILQFNLPIFSICPKNSFAEKVTNINIHKKYIDADGNSQKDITFFNNAKTPHIEISTPTKNTIGVVDGIPHMPHLPGISARSTFSHRKKDIEDSLRSRGLQLMDFHQAVVFQHQTLGNSSLQGNKPDLIADFYRSGADTVSCISNEHLPEYKENESYINYICFSASNRMIHVNAATPTSTGAHLRGRPFMLILEY